MSADILTAEEARAKHITAMGDDLGRLYSALWQEIVWLHRKWTEYVVLFGTKESRIELLNNAAPQFARMVQDSLWEDVLLHMARLTDPPKSAGKSNLSIQALLPLIDHTETKTTVQSQIARALAASEFCRDWRNRHLAHRDLHLALKLGAEPLKSGSRLNVTEALKSFATILNTISARYLESTTFFDSDADFGGALSLLAVLDLGLAAKEAKRERLKNGIYEPDDYKQRDL
ncbi:MAG TPA: hypothetical protein VJS89_09850 [Gammaproteobacteria bacterium]|nr:hypothetical protein [Gammaproteobacteria bacterium]